MVPTAPLQRKNHQKGEITTILTLVGMGVMLLGAMVGSWAIKTNQRQTLQPKAFGYLQGNPTLGIYDPSNNTVSINGTACYTDYLSSGSENVTVWFTGNDVSSFAPVSRPYSGTNGFELTCEHDESAMSLVSVATMKPTWKAEGCKSTIIEVHVQSNRRGRNDFTLTLNSPCPSPTPTVVASLTPTPSEFPAQCMESFHANCNDCQTAGKAWCRFGDVSKCLGTGTACNSCGGTVVASCPGTNPSPTPTFIPGECRTYNYSTCQLCTGAGAVWCQMGPAKVCVPTASLCTSECRGTVTSSTAAQCTTTPAASPTPSSTPTRTPTPVAGTVPAACQTLTQNTCGLCQNAGKIWCSTGGGRCVDAVSECIGDCSGSVISNCTQPEACRYGFLAHVLPNVGTLDPNLSFSVDYEIRNSVGQTTAGTLPFQNGNAGTTFQDLGESYRNSTIKLHLNIPSGYIIHAATCSRGGCSAGNPTLQFPMLCGAGDAINWIVRNTNAPTAPIASADVVSDGVTNALDWSFALTNFGQVVTINGSSYQITGDTLDQIIEAYAQ